MEYMMILLMQGVLVGLVVVASNPSPYFAVFGLVGMAGASCGLMVFCGGTFLSLILFLIYLGGMLVVFAYSSALASEVYPEAWGNPGVATNLIVYLAGLLAASIFLVKGELWEGGILAEGGLHYLRGDLSGVGEMYGWGGWMLSLAGLTLLVTLFVVLEVVRGGVRGALRAV
uniref:NADH-ubiquinone oxidoreductase chain 6 n=1 Tax=Kraemeria cunicularia TaxID=86209 RepID=A0A347Z6J1_9GOBI|nr:NADH dehydrogenase subunit 6 [Kraemeria cunicularia]BBA12782.1 NADH dehydrogenase subunit 6 [Kraemeria cunicularia]